MKIGSKVKFIGSSDEQVKWGNNDDPKKILNKKEIYTIENIEVHSWHTKIYLEDIKGKFNSISFEEISN